MSKAFVREDADTDDDDLPEAGGEPLPAKNYMTPAGHRRMSEELMHLLNVERPQVVSTVAWAASNGDRSENGDYLYGKKRLREIDRRIRFLTRRLEKAEVVDPARQRGLHQVFFGATVTYEQVSDGAERTVQIVGVDEVDPLNGKISWISPVAKALMKAREGDSVTLQTPGGIETLEVVEIRYEDGR